MQHDPIQEIYAQLIDIQQTLLESQASMNRELNDIKRCINDRLMQVELKTNHHDMIFTHLTRVITWIVPSGTLLGLIGWFSGFFGHK